LRLTGIQVYESCWHRIGPALTGAEEDREP
jgi:hypothetical protein